MTLLAAFLGWLFDGFEMGLFPLIGQPALKDLLGPASDPLDATKWFGAIIAVFLVGAASGGVVFGWLGDKIGRVRAMSLSIFTYAIFTGLCGFATEAWHIAVLRFVASLGMGGEWSLGVALVNEIWPGKNRALIAGLIGAAANIGYLLVAVLSMVLLSFIATAKGMFLGIGFSEAFTTKLLSNYAWRFLMISGALPALLIFFILIFVPESAKWEAERKRGATSHWAKVDLFGVLIGSLAALVIIWAWSPAGVGALAATAITVVGLGIALIGFLYPMRKYIERAELVSAIKPGQGAAIVKMMLFGAALAAVALLGTWGSTQWAPRWVLQLEPDAAKQAKEWTLFWLSVGAITGTMIAALAAGRFGRRITYAVLCVASIAGALLLYQCNTSYSPFFLFSAFVAGAATASFYGFFPLYLPELFPTAVRATGQGFAFNFGRIVAAIGSLQTANLMKIFDNSFPKAASVMTVIYVIGMCIVWIGPETKGKELPE
ncbi:MAG: MFS transporter [Verrucomicrobia bacterium]|nr:MFS transporter [Verrucomicrobiota bacterium]NBU08146.1 MFS transporter [Pseudomonadota bacterium]NDA68521.1 MFS transporter [Verrucomicrobiota bacterium]NDB76635.1 MFS transporter [Verrucomicrobiota bacterium]NDD40234.1 MFS transporter [Verrucomicrobiota bacterium]